METLEEEKDSVRKKNDTDIAPVHSATNKDCKSKKQKDQSMKVKVEECTSQNIKDAMSQWLWGGDFGDKGTILVFRSCVLSSQINSSQLVSNDSSSSESKSEIEPFGSPVPKWESDIFDEVSDNNVNPRNAGCQSDIKRKRDIRDVLNDLNRVATKKKFNTNDPETSTNQRNTISKSVLVCNMPNIHKSKRSSIKGKLMLTSKSTSLPSTVDHMLNDESIFNTVVNKSSNTTDFSNITILEKSKMPAALLNITYKTAMTETKLLSKMLQAHGLSDVDAQSKHFNLMWSGLHPKPDVLRSLKSYQRVNHFPRSYELTRKDKLFKNIEKMQYFHGQKNFDFIPMTFLMPVEYKDLCTAHYRLKGPWIVKPAASSRGRGIYIVNTPDQIPKGESVVVAKYIDKPLLVNGHKCDLRLYVCVTSFDPLLIYMYEEGLVRFATVKYDRSNKSLWNPCMHLCNYSINKYHSDYIKCEDPCAENVGHKWTLSAFLRYLRDHGHDTLSLMSAIEDLVIKSILSCTQSIASASRMFVPYFSNCFELYGFDILIDEALKPWLLEINLSPSLGCDSPLDVRLKSAMLADTFNLAGIPAIDSYNECENVQQTGKCSNLKMRMKACRRVHSAESMPSKKKGFGSNGAGSVSGTDSGLSVLSNDEIRIVKVVKAQYQRRGGFVRIFPSQDSWKKYAQYLDSSTGVPVSSLSIKNSLDSLLITHNYNLLVHTHVLKNFDQTVVSQNNSSNPPERLKRYERVLPACTRVTLDNNIGNGKFSASKSMIKKELDANNKVCIKQQIQHGMNLSLGESRRVFSMFLMLVLKRISNSTSEQSGQHADLILRFLKKATHTLKMPHNIKSPSQKMSDKDKAAVIAKQLNDFLHIYNRETDISADSSSSLLKDTLEDADYSNFIHNASEADLEDILLTILKKEGNVAPFLGDKISPMCVDIPPNSSQLLNKDVPLRHQLLRYLAYVTPVHSRRFKPPNLNSAQSLPPLVNESSQPSDN